MGNIEQGLTEAFDAKALLDELSEVDPNSLDEFCICLEHKPMSFYLVRIHIVYFA